MNSGCETDSECTFYEEVTKQIMPHKVGIDEKGEGSKNGAI